MTKSKQDYLKEIEEVFESVYDRENEKEYDSSDEAKTVMLLKIISELLVKIAFKGEWGC